LGTRKSLAPAEKKKKMLRKGGGSFTKKATQRNRAIA